MTNSFGVYHLVNYLSSFKKCQQATTLTGIEVFGKTVRCYRANRVFVQNDDIRCDKFLLSGIVVDFEG